jgi:cytochrome b6
MSFTSWLAERIPLVPLSEFLRTKSVPRHRYTFWYFFGGLTLLFLLVQITTGILLAMYYTPSVEHAHESVQSIVNQVPHGWLIRSLHAWSANLLIGSLFVHMFSVFLLKAYRKPLELLWLSGVLLMLLVLGFAFTGYLLPWDTRAYFATLIGTEVPRSVPVLGELAVGILKGGEEIGGATLARMYAIHVIVLPLILVFIVSLHILHNQFSGPSVPIGTRVKEGSIPFFPNFALRDSIAWLLGLMVLIGLATMLPWGLGEKADPYASAPLGIRPEWFFLPLYQTLRMVPPAVFGISGEMLVNACVGLAIAAWAAVPFLDRRAARGERSRVFTVVGAMTIVYLIGTIVLAYLT